MIGARTRTVGLTGLLMFAAARAAEPCSCPSSGPPCQATWQADAVFAGTVLAIESSGETNATYPGMRFSVVRFRVEEPLLNSAAGPLELSSVFTSCEFRFVVGEKYLVYAYKRDSGQLTTSVCSRTRRLAEAEDDLRYLRSIPPGGAGGRVYGRVTEWRRDPAEEQGVDYGPVQNLVVHVRGAGFSQDVVTDRHGRFELTGVSLGEVSVTLLAPLGFGTHQQEGLELKDSRGCVEANFTIIPEAEVTGVVLDTAGRPVAGAMIDAVAAELAAYRPAAYQHPVKTDERGRFTFERLPPGSYVFGINLTKPQGRFTPGPPTFYPGTAAVDQAVVVELTPGDQKDLGVLRVPPR